MGRLRIKLSKMLYRDLKIECEPEDIQPANGRNRNLTSMGDVYAWEVFGTKNGVCIVAGCFETMTECCKRGMYLTLNHGEISAREQK